MKTYFFIAILFSVSVYGQKKFQIDSLALKKKATLGKLISLDDFLTFWILNNTKDPRMPRMKYFCEDSVYTYFFKNGKSFKILNNDIRKIDYKSINGDSLTNHLYYSAIPKSDRDKGDNCLNAFLTPTFKCKFISVDTIELSCHYKITCDFVQVLNKNYAVIYNLNDKTHKILDTTKGGHNK